MTQAGVTEGTLLGGRVAYAQPATGYRTGIEPVLLAASVPARRGERVVEAGTGAGAGLLALAARVPELELTGIERDPALAALARANLAANGHIGATVSDIDLAGWRPAQAFDHAFANPPWHDTRGTPSPSPGRLAAKMATPGLLAAWCAALARGLRHRGSLSLILDAGSTARGLAALVSAGCAEAALLPLWPHAGEPARLVIVRGVRDGRGPARVLPGLVLHGPDGAYTEAAEAVLRLGTALPM